MRTGTMRFKMLYIWNSCDAEKLPSQSQIAFRLIIATNDLG